ncbi:unnamed protein product [Larinioides sclopetarius]|uniref:Uncharacterized protein n=1 Tax=Larinioides sclopetarius TaxID=280406 RepID=A0AAV2ABL7_9ARAC
MQNSPNPGAIDRELVAFGDAFPGTRGQPCRAQAARSSREVRQKGFGEKTRSRRESECASASQPPKECVRLTVPPSTFPVADLVCTIPQGKTFSVISSLQMKLQKNYYVNSKAVPKTDVPSGWNMPKAPFWDIFVVG